MSLHKIRDNQIEPDDYWVCVRLLDLAIHYHPDAIERYLYNNLLCYSVTLEWHLDNLISTYGINSVLNNWTIISTMKQGGSYGQ